MSRASALAGYGRLLRTQRQLFGSDLKNLQLAKRKTREEFEVYSNTDTKKNRSITDPKRVDDLIKDIDETITFLRQNVVQAVKSDDGGRYRLHVTKETGRIFA